MRKFKDFTEDELYILKRQSIEGSFNVIMSDNYSEEEKDLHRDISNQILEEIKIRKTH